MKEPSQKPVKILLVTLVLALVFLFGHVSAVVIYGKQSVNSSKFNLSSNKGERLEAGDMEIFWEVYGQLADNYLEKELPDNKKLAESATKGLVKGFDDKYTNYYTKEEWEELQKGNSGQFQGVGIKLQAGEDYAIVETPVRGSPAHKAGVMAGDWIMQVDGKSVEGQSISKVAEQIRGEKGTKVKLKVFRPSNSQDYDFEITRDNIDIDSIEVTKLANGGYQITISKFTEESYAEFVKQWDDAVDEVNKGNAKFIILDLRNNTGGWVDAAKYVLGEFLPKGTLIMSEVDRDQKNETVKTEREGVFTKTPLVVLVNGGSASASEIVAGALQDIGRAKLVGTSTIGKGVEQRIVSTSDGGSLHIVFRKWLTPKGRSLAADDALKPDKEVNLTNKDTQAGKDPQLEEALKMVK